jgi:peptidyl-prolyl cis-trans isomerase SurA
MISTLVPFRLPLAPTLLALALLALPALAPHAQAQSIVAVVNGTPITSLEVSQRRNFVHLTQKKNLSQREVVDQLIDETLIIKEAARRHVSIPDSDVESRFGTVARGMKISPAQLTQALAQRGTSARTFKQTIRSQLLYQKLVQSRFNPMNAISEDKIASAMAERKGSERETFKATLRQIIFVLPKNASEGLVAQRRREAQGLRSRFHSCESGLAMAHGLRDVAVKDPVIRNTAQLGEQTRQALNKIKVGQTLPPERTDQGIELVALCDKQAAKDDSGLRQEIQVQLAGERFKVEARAYILDLRQRAIIQYR